MKSWSGEKSTSRMLHPTSRAWISLKGCTGAGAAAAPPLSVLESLAKRHLGHDTMEGRGAAVEAEGGDVGHGVT